MSMPWKYRISKADVSPCSLSSKWNNFFNFFPQRPISSCNRLQDATCYLHTSRHQINNLKLMTQPSIQRKRHRNISESYNTASYLQYANKDRSWSL